MNKKHDYYSFGCPGCGKGTMMPNVHGHRCNKCSHFENDSSTYSIMEQDRGADILYCHCPWCESKGQKSNSVNQM